MKTITVAELRQNPTDALADVERGESYVVTRHRRVVARLVPPGPRSGATPADYDAMVAATPLATDWAAEVAAQRRAVDGRDDPWQRTA